MVLVTDQTRVAVWDTLCDLEWNERYYLEMAKQRQQIHRILRYAIVGGYSPTERCFMPELSTLGCSSWHYSAAL